MKLNITTILVLLGIVVLSNAFIWIKYYKLQQQYLSVSENKPANENVSAISHLGNRVINDTQIPTVFDLKQTTTVTDTAGAAVPLANIFTDTVNYFVFRFSPKLHCNSCIEEAINSISAISNSRNRRIILLTSETTPRDLAVIAHKYNVPFAVYSIDPAMLPQSLERLKEPYMFILNNKLHAESAFVVEYDLAFLASKYLSRINDRF
jgi:hypothetical protein